MAGITLEMAEQKLAVWLEANDQIAQGQSYSIATATGSRSLSRADLAEVQNQIVFWNGQIKKLSRGGLRIRGAVPLG